MTNEERTDELTQKAKETYRIYSEDKCIDSYEGYRYIDGYCNGYEQDYEDCRHYAHDYYKPKWHEIKCCSQDLPTRSKDNHLHSVIVSNEYGDPIYYDYNIDEWCDMKGDVVSEGYKYWCELPKFEE